MMHWHVVFDEDNYLYPVSVKLYDMRFEISRNHAAMLAMFLAKYIDITDTLNEISFGSYQGIIHASWTDKRSVWIRSLTCASTEVVLQEHVAKDISHNLIMTQGFRTKVEIKARPTAKEKTDDNLREVFG